MREGDVTFAPPAPREGSTTSRLVFSTSKARVDEMAKQLKALHDRNRALQVEMDDTRAKLQELTKRLAAVEKLRK